MEGQEYTREGEPAGDVIRGWCSHHPRWPAGALNEETSRRAVCSRLSPRARAVRLGSLVSEAGFRGDVGFPWLLASGFVGLLLRDQAADALGQQRPVKRFFKCVVKPEREGFLARFVAGQGEQDRPHMIGALAQILRDLTGFDPAQ